MEIAAAVDFVRDIRRGVLATIRSDGRPQLSNVLAWVDDDGLIRLSLTASRAKTANIRRDPRVVFHVTSEDFWSYVVIDADAELTPIAAVVDDATVDELVDYYRALNGEHPDWNEYRAAMVADQRLVARLHPSRAYGSLGR